MISPARAVKEARYWNHAAVFAASFSSVPATIKKLRENRDYWMKVARGKRQHV